jgi:hypothetical protein
MKLRNACTGRVVNYPGVKDGSGDELAAPVGKWGPRILVFDIETTPMLSWHWRTWKENIAPIQTVKHSRLLCWAAKWIDSNMIYFDSTQKDGDNDKRCSYELWKLCDQADILVAHNGRAFDMAKLNARWVKHGIEPPSPSKWVDTLKVARARFCFPSNKLDGIARYLNLGTKLEHEGFGLWLRCMDGERKAWKRMRDYNIQDVLLEEELYLKIRAWDNRHPNVELFYEDGEDRCVCCGGRALKELAQPAHTSVLEFTAFRCQKCKKVMRSRKSNKGNRATKANVI